MSMFPKYCNIFSSVRFRSDRSSLTKNKEKSNSDGEQSNGVLQYLEYNRKTKYANVMQKLAVSSSARTRRYQINPTCAAVTPR